MKIQGCNIDISKLTVEEINKLRKAVIPEMYDCDIAEKYFVRILARDCRSDSTKEYLAKYDAHRDSVILYKKQKTQIVFNTILSVDVLFYDTYCTGTTTYELVRNDKITPEIIKYIRKKRGMK